MSNWAYGHEEGVYGSIHLRCPEMVCNGTLESGIWSGDPKVLSPIRVDAVGPAGNGSRRLKPKQEIGETNQPSPRLLSP